MSLSFSTPQAGARFRRMNLHFYTQYFERLGASPGSILIAGLVALGIACAIVRYNKAARVAVAEGGIIA